MNTADKKDNFINESTTLLREWMDTRYRIYKLKTIRTLSKIAGQFLWIIVSLLLLFLLVVFLGLTLGFWLSSLTGSFIQGFGMVTVLIILLIVVLNLFKKHLFINPFIRKFTAAAKKKHGDK